MNHLPDDIKRIIWEFDKTYHVKWKTCVKHIKKMKKMHIVYKKRFYHHHRRSDIINFSTFALQNYIDKKHSKLLFKWYYYETIDQLLKNSI